MNTENTPSIPETAATDRQDIMAQVRVKPRTNTQIKASAIADNIAITAKWRTLVGEARTVWEKVPAEDLAKVNGNFHKLAGLVQLRYQVSREESDRQVRDFFGKHYATGPSTVPTR